MKDRRNPKPVTPPSYEVGYKKPPVATRFKKGQSGNPSGRPKGRKQVDYKLSYVMPEETFKDIFLEEAGRLVNINTGRGEEEIEISRAVIRALGAKAASGHIGSQRLFADKFFEIEAERKAEGERRMDNMINYNSSWNEELERRAKLGLPLEPPVPHPDDVHIDMRRGTIEIRGPLTREEKEEKEFYGEMLERWRESRSEAEQTLSGPVETEEQAAAHADAAAELALCHEIIPALERLSATAFPQTPFDAYKMIRRRE